MSEPSAAATAPAVEEPAPRKAWRRELKLLRYAKPHRKGFAGMVCAALVGVGASLARPWPLKVLIDNVIDGKPIPHWLAQIPGADSRHGLLVWVVVAEVVIFLVSTLAAMFTSYASLTLGQYMTWSLAGDLFRHLQRLSLLFHTRREAGDLIERVTTDSYSVDTLLTGAVLPVIQAVATLISVLVVMLALDVKLTFLAISVIPLIIIATRFFGRPMRERAREQRDSEGRMASVVEQTLGAMPAVQAFTREEYQERALPPPRREDGPRLRAQRDHRHGLPVRDRSGAHARHGGGALRRRAAGARRRADRRDDRRVRLLRRLAVRPDRIAVAHRPDHPERGRRDRSRDGDHGDRTGRRRPARRERSPGRPARSATRTSRFGYQQGRPVLHEISFAADPGEVLAVVGPTGAGKTTMASLLVRFFDPWQGRITIGGTDIRDFTLHSLRSQIALVLQDPFIFPISIAENIALGKPDAPREEIVAAAEAANAHMFIERLPARLRHACRRARARPSPAARSSGCRSRARSSRTHRC